MRPGKENGLTAGVPDRLDCENHGLVICFRVPFHEHCFAKRQDERTLQFIAQTLAWYRNRIQMKLVPPINEKYQNVGLTGRDVAGHVYHEAHGMMFCEIRVKYGSDWDDDTESRGRNNCAWCHSA